MNWQIYVTDRAGKQLKKLPKNDAERIRNAIDEMELNPFSGDIEKLSGYDDVWRRRVGSYRLLYEIHIAKRIIYIKDGRLAKDEMNKKQVKAKLSNQQDI